MAGLKPMGFAQMLSEQFSSKDKDEPSRARPAAWTEMQRRQIRSPRLTIAGGASPASLYDEYK